jgi:oxalate decarboxylase/phosphoglucose isomerase-like protein (cupin superfamily)
MNPVKFRVFILIALIISMIVSVSVIESAIAKPVGRNPGTSWPSGTVWGTNLRLENDIYVGQAWFGTRSSEIKVGAAPDPPDGLIVEFFDGSKWAIWVKVPAANENWPVRMRNVGIASSSGTLSSLMENADTVFVPQDYSVVLENATLGLKANLRKENKLITGLPVLATLYVDNAVNIQSIDNLDPLNGAPGDNLRLNVFVKNTGRYTDNYTVSAGGSLDPTILNLAPGVTDNVIVVTTLPNGTENIVVTVAGNYATDQDYVTATGVVRGVQVVISPSSQENVNGGTLTYNITVNNTGTIQENFQLTKGENTDWTLNIENNFLVVPIGENRTTVLTVNIPTNATGGTLDNIWVRATSEDDIIFDNKSCLAQAAIVRGVQVVISPSSQENVNGGTLTYNITVNNTGNVQENFQLTKGDNTGWTLNLDNIWLLVPKGENRTTKLNVNILSNALGDTSDNIWVQANSKDDTTVLDNKTCLAHVIILRNVNVSILPGHQGTLASNTLYYLVSVKNNGNVPDNYLLTITDTAGWSENILPTSFIISPWNTENATLSVTVPPGAIAGSSDNIMVRATLTENENIYAENLCIAYAYAESTINLVAGWNLVCFPLTSDSATPDNAFTGLTYYTDYYIYYWSAPSGPYVLQGPDEVLNDNIGYWVWIKENKAVTTSGIPLISRDIRLVAGWNMVGFPVVNAGTTPDNVFIGLTYYTNYYLYNWNAPTGPYVLQGPDQALENDLGYWTWIDRDNTVTVP